MMVPVQLGLAGDRSWCRRRKRFSAVPDDFHRTILNRPGRFSPDDFQPSQTIFQPSHTIFNRVAADENSASAPGNLDYEMFKSRRDG
jgi:hypothetical protein